MYPNIRTAYQDKKDAHTRAHTRGRIRVTHTYAGVTARCGVKCVHAVALRVSTLWTYVVSTPTEPNRTQPNHTHDTHTTTSIERVALWHHTRRQRRERAVRCAYALRLLDTRCTACYDSCGAATVNSERATMPRKRETTTNNKGATRAHLARVRGWKARFIESYRLTGNVTLSAEAAGVAYSTVYRALDPARGDAAFMDAVANADAESTDRLKEAARVRGVDGVDEPIYSAKGVLLGYTKRYSDRCLLWLLDYKTGGATRRVQIGGMPGQPVESKVTVVTNIEPRDESRAVDVPVLESVCNDDTERVSL